MGGCVWNLEPAVSAGREQPAGDGGLHVAVRRSPIEDQNALRRSPVAGREPGARGLRGQGTARRGRRSPRSGPVFADCGSECVSIRRSPVAGREPGARGLRGQRSPRATVSAGRERPAGDGGLQTETRRSPVNKSLHRHLAHPPPVQRHNQPTVLHVTVCTAGRQKILATAEVQAVLVDAWRAAAHWLTGRYVIMPDHLHFFCVPGVIDYPPVRRWAGFWKRLVGKREPALACIFQEDCWDTQMRSREHYEEKVSYIRNNPVRAGLVSVSEAWPFQGKVHDVPHW